MLRSQIDCNNQRKGFGWKQVKKIKKIVSVKIRQIFLPEHYVPKIKERSESATFHFKNYSKKNPPYQVLQKRKMGKR